MNELAIIEALAKQCPSNPSVIFGIGDDSAVLAPSSAQQLVCKDMLLAGVHFLTAEHPPEALGRKALAVNLSDIAAMGGVALSAYVALALPRSLLQDPSYVERLYRGISGLAASYEVSIAGGDTNIWDGPLVISVTVVGRTHPKGAVLRGGAREGDEIWVTGPLGNSYRSGHHLSFEPRLRAAASLMQRADVHAMIDVSDGLGKDLRQLAQASALKAVLEPTALPLRPGLNRGAEGLARALSDGEDFELCFTLAPGHAVNSWPELTTAVRIGRMRAGSGLAWEDGSPIEAMGYEHRS